MHAGLGQFGFHRFRFPVFGSVPPNGEELLDLRDVVLNRSDGWKDMRSGDDLEPQQINLYHLMYHHIAPRTAVEGVYLDLEGLEEPDALLGDSF